MIFKNLSSVTLTFYGVTFEPNSVHEVPGPINAPMFVRVFELPKSEAPAETKPEVTTETPEIEKVFGRRKGKTVKESEDNNGNDND